MFEVLQNAATMLGIYCLLVWFFTGMQILSDPFSPMGLKDWLLSPYIILTTGIKFIYYWVKNE